MALQDLERQTYRSIYGRPVREPGMSWQAYAYLALLIGSISFVGYSTYHAKPQRSEPPAMQRQLPPG